MTMPSERTQAILRVERFLLDLRDPKKYPRVPKAVREEASRLLKHYPSKYNMKYIADSFEPLERIDYEQNRSK
jgi:hypothetical protein